SSDLNADRHPRCSARKEARSWTNLRPQSDSANPCNVHVAPSRHAHSSCCRYNAKKIPLVQPLSPERQKSIKRAPKMPEFSGSSTFSKLFVIGRLANGLLLVLYPCQATGASGRVRQPGLASIDLMGGERDHERYDRRYLSPDGRSTRRRSTLSTPAPRHRGCGQ